MWLHTLQDLSLLCCTSLCCLSVAGFFLISSFARWTGNSLGNVVEGVGGGGLFGLLSLGGLMNIAQLGLEFLGGGEDEQPRESQRRRR